MTIDLDFIMQLISIFGTFAVLIFFWNLWVHKPYSIFHILIRFLFYNDSEPFDWLIRHIGYIGVLMLIVGNMFSILGQLEEIRTGEIHAKLWEFFVSNPMNSLGLLLFCFNPAMTVVKKFKPMFHHK